MVGVLAQWHFAPTVVAKNNLVNEGVLEQKIIVTGNTIIDALLDVTEIIKSNSLLSAKAEINYPFIVPDRKIILVTGHRRENFGGGFDRICESLVRIANQNPDVDIVYPVHLNPNVREPVNRLLGDIENIYVIEP